MTMRELCEDVAGGLRDGRAIKAVQIGGPLGGILPASLLDTRSTSTRWPPRAAWSATAGSSPSTTRPTCATSPATCCTSAPPRAAASASPAGSACAARTRCSPTASRSTARTLEALLETLELGQPVRARRRHARADPQPAHALPRRAGARMITVEIDGTATTVAPGTHGPRRRQLAGGEVPTLCFDDRQAPFGACRVCLVGVEGAPGPIAACTTPVRDGMEVDTADAAARRVATAVVELVLSELPEPPARAHRAGRRRADARRRRAALARRGPRRATTTSATPTSPSATSSASRAGAACARATRSRARSR